MSTVLPIAFALLGVMLQLMFTMLPIALLNRPRFEPRELLLKLMLQLMLTVLPIAVD